MTRTTIILSALIFFSVLLRGEDGLFSVQNPKDIMRSVKGDHLIVKVPVKRVEILHAVLRRDTEKENDYYWLECHMKKFLDPEGESIFFVDGTEVDGFVVRSSEVIPKGNKWALMIANPDSGRKLLNKIAKIYDLNEAAIDDQTKSQ